MRRAHQLLLAIFILALSCANATLAQAQVQTQAQAQAKAGALQTLFNGEKLTQHDSVLVLDESGQVLYSWQADKPLVPASLVKLATAYLSIKKWGGHARFTTDFYRHGNTLWVKGYGDPYLTSEELGALAQKLSALDLGWVQNIAIDGSHFTPQPVPGGSQVVDPYNAPLSAVAANFNTVKLMRNAAGIHSAEPQTPVTATAKQVAIRLGRPKKGTTERINLVNQDNALTHFAELLNIKLEQVNIKLEQASADLPSKPTKALPVSISGVVPMTAALIYQHRNSHDVSDAIRGMLEFSNNFIANQLFLMLTAQAPLSFKQASCTATQQLAADFDWQNFSIVEGSGLSRQNKLSASQLADLLQSLTAHQHLFKSYSAGIAGVTVTAKTGTLNGVRSFAGFIQSGDQKYRFVFNFNRQVPYKYRETLMRKTAAVLAQKTTQ